MKPDEKDPIAPFINDALDDEDSSDLSQEDVSQALELLAPEGALVPPVDLLLARVATAPEKYAPFFSRVATLFALDEEKVVDLLHDEGWKRSPIPGVRFKDVDSGLNNPDVSAAVVRFEAGTKYPKHQHTHDEHVLILEGGYVDDSGTRHEAGELHTMRAGSEHAFTVDTDGPCIAASVADKKLSFSSPIWRTLAKLIGR